MGWGLTVLAPGGWVEWLLPHNGPLFHRKPQKDRREQSQGSPRRKMKAQSHHPHGASHLPTAVAWWRLGPLMKPVAQKILSRAHTDSFRAKTPLT